MLLRDYLNYESARETAAKGKTLIARASSKFTHKTQATQGQHAPQTRQTYKNTTTSASLPLSHTFKKVADADYQACFRYYSSKSTVNNDTLLSQ